MSRNFLFKIYRICPFVQFLINYFLDPQNDLNKLSIVSTIKQKRDLGRTLEEPGRATPCSAPKTLKKPPWWAWAKIYFHAKEQLTHKKKLPLIKISKN